MATVGALGETIAIEVIQEQIKKKIKKHQKEFDELKEIKSFVDSLLEKDDIEMLNAEEKKVLSENLVDIEAFMQANR